MSSPPGAGFRLEVEPRLAEEAVLLAVAKTGGALEIRFRRERDPIYELAERGERERTFTELHRRWLEALGLLRPLWHALDRNAAIAARTSRGLVVRAASAREEYADLHESRRPAATAPVLVMRLRAETLVDPTRLPPLLSRELLHVSDLLDPAFGFDPHAPDHVDSPALRALVRQRYRVVWETTVDGRLAALGELPEEVRGRRRRQFLGAFSMLGPGAEPAFERFFAGPRPSHAELWSFAAHPDPARPHGGCCPLCRLPAAELASAGELGRAVLVSIGRDFPSWRPQSGLCRQCADLYRVLARDDSPPAAESHASERAGPSEPVELNANR